MTIKVSDKEKLKNDVAYQKFLIENPGKGTLKIRVTSANEAIPVSGVSFTVTKEIGENTIIFFEGKTDDSGMINDIVLPTPSRVSSDEDVPSPGTYKLRAVYEPQQFDKTYNVVLYCGIVAIQYINITPNIQTEVRKKYGF